MFLISRLNLGISDSARFRLGLAEAGPDLKNYLFYVFNACFVLLDSRPIFSKPRPGLNLAKTVGPKSAEAESAD